MDSAQKTTITLAGKSFDIPCLPFKKCRAVVPAASYALKAVARSNGPEKEPLNVTAIDYLYVAVFEAVSYAYPSVTREQFDKWEISLTELLAALTAISLQTGVLVRVAGDKKPEGEAMARN